MSKLVNLNRFKKQKAREDKRRAGDRSAARHGLSKSEKDLSAARLAKAERDLDGHEKE